MSVSQSDLGLISPAPGNDAHTTLLYLVLRVDLEDAVSPQDVDISGEHVGRPVRSRHGQHRLSLGVLEGGFSL